MGVSTLARIGGPQKPEVRTIFFCFNECPFVYRLAEEWRVLSHKTKVPSRVVYWISIDANLVFFILDPLSIKMVLHEMAHLVPPRARHLCCSAFSARFLSSVSRKAGREQRRAESDVRTGGLLLPFIERCHYRDGRFAVLGPVGRTLGQCEVCVAQWNLGERESAASGGEQ